MPHDTGKTQITFTTEFLYLIAPLRRLTLDLQKVPHLLHALVNVTYEARRVRERTRLLAWHVEEETMVRGEHVAHAVTFVRHRAEPSARAYLEKGDLVVIVDVMTSKGLSEHFIYGAFNCYSVFMNFKTKIICWSRNCFTLFSLKKLIN